jgi:cbb3-type cytochrome oxidase subunit 3
MKKEGAIVLVLLILVLLAVNVYALGENDANQDAPADPEAGGNFWSAGDQDVDIPPNLQFAARVLFGLKTDQDVSFNLLIVIISVLGGFVILIHSILRFVPIFKKEWVMWAVAVVVTLLASSTGGFIAFASMLFGFSAKVEFLNKWSMAYAFVTLVLIFLLAIGLNKLLKKMKKAQEVANAEDVGFRASAPAAIVKKMK